MSVSVPITFQVKPLGTALPIQASNEIDTLIHNRESLEHLRLLICEINNVAVDMYTKGEFMSSVELFQEALQAIRRLGFIRSRMNSDIESQRIRCDTSTRLLSKIVEGKENLEELNSSLIPITLDMYGQNSRLSSGSFSFNSPIKLQNQKERSNEILDESIVLINLGIVNLRQNLPRDAIDLLQLAKDIISSQNLENRSLYGIIGNCLGCAEISLGLIAEGLELFRESQALCESIMNIGLEKQIVIRLQETLGSIASNIGRLHFNRREYKESAARCWEAFKHRREALGDEDVEVCTTMYNLGLINQIQENFNEAIVFFQLFLDRASLPVKGDDISNRDVVTVLSNVLLIHCKKFTFSDKNTELQQSLKRLKSSRFSLGAENPNIPGLLSHVANNLNELSLHQYALPFFYEKLRVEKVFLGGKHPELASTLNCIGQSFLKQQCFTQAMSYFSQARKVLSGNCNTSVYASTSFNLGLAHYHTGNHDQAMTFFNEALSTLRIALGEYHPDVAELHHNIGVVQLEIGRIEVAMTNLMGALLIRRMVYGNDHHIVSESLYKIAQIHDLKGEHNEALNVYQETLRIERANLGDNSVDVAITLRNIGQIYHSAGNLTKCIEAYIELINILRVFLGENHKVIASMYNVLAGVCLETGRSSEATTFYKESRRIMEVIENAPDLLNVNESEFEQKIFAVFGSNVEISPPAAAAA